MLWAPVFLYMALIFGLSSVAQPPLLPGAVSDKYLHILLYAGLSALFVRALSRGWTRPVTRGLAALAILLSTVYGVSDEIHQYFVPPRQMDALDVVADAIGAALAAGALYAGIIPGRHGL